MSIRDKPRTLPVRKTTLEELIYQRIIAIAEDLIEDFHEMNDETALTLATRMVEIIHRDTRS